MNSHTSENNASRGARGKVALISVVAGILCALSAGVAVAQENVCAHIKQAVQSNGHYVYHYKDAANPGVPLYNVYVRSSSQCAADEMAESRPVPSLIDCDVPTCVTGYDYGAR